MKTYILRDPKAVEPQKSIRPPRPKPTAPVTVKGPVLFIGLDVHNDSIAVRRARTPGERAFADGFWAVAMKGKRRGQRWPGELSARRTKP